MLSEFLLSPSGCLTVPPSVGPSLVFVLCQLWVVICDTPVQGTCTKYQRTCSWCGSPNWKLWRALSNFQILVSKDLVYSCVPIQMHRPCVIRYTAFIGAILSYLQSVSKEWVLPIATWVDCRSKFSLMCSLIKWLTPHHCGNAFVASSNETKMILLLQLALFSSYLARLSSAYSILSWPMVSLVVRATVHDPCR